MRARQAVSVDPTSRFRTDIQGLRAIAVGAVVLYHAGVPFLPGGYVGVDIFFVISGFLITSHLLSGIQRQGRIHFASFYAKRARRILPASFVVLALSVVAALIWYPPLLMKQVWMGAIATALYVPNYLFAAEGTNYLSESTPSLFQHYWSLGVEEQFYLLWPLLLAIGFVLVRRPKALFGLIVLIVGASFLACVVLTFRAQPWAFFALPTRAWELGVGGLAAFLLTYRPEFVGGATAAVIGWLGLAGIIGSTVVFSGTTQFPGYWAAIPVLSTAAVIIAGDSASKYSPHAALSVRPMLWVGLISYSLYLVHWPLLQVPQAAVGFENPLPLWATLALGAASVPVAWLMYRFIEEPGRKGRWLASARPRRSLLAAAGASLAVIVIATGSYAYSNSRPLNSGESAPETLVATPPEVTNYVPTNMHPTLRGVAGDQPVIYADGCHLDFADTRLDDCVYGDPSAPRIVLFGDSHAAQWFPALRAYAEANGYSLESRTKSSCPSVSAPILRNQVPYTECTSWRDAVIDRINSERPVLVVLANYGVAPLADPGDDYAAAWGAALGATIDAIHTRTVVLADTPDLRSTPSVCLSANLDYAEECGLPRDEALDNPARAVEKATAAEHKTPYIDLTDYICSPDACDPILGNTLVYRDAHHLTATYSAELSTELGSRLVSYLGGS
ncbi:MAG: acyltransferase family protein [Microbacterium sp.]|uniref:acyltransferase family protein n=1 Tax=Microbacterium sp. TaxID=51671 RepID=UPI003F7F125E